jgi:hypothetical protein
VGPTCQTPLSMPGPPGSAPLPRGCHAPCSARALNVLSRPRAGVPTAQRCSDRPRSDRAAAAVRTALRCPVSTAPSPLYEVAPPPCPNPVAVRPSSTVASFVYGERRLSLPLIASLPWSVELTFPSLLTVDEELR